MAHALTWFEIPTPDLDAAQRFYEAVCGVSLQRARMGGEALAMFPKPTPDAPGGCLQQIGPGVARPSVDGVLVYLSAGPSVSAALERAVAAGGRVATPRTALPPGMGAFAHIVDPHGNRVGLHAPD